MEEHSNNTLFYSGSDVTSSRVLYTPSPFARSSLLYLQETGHLTALKPHVSGRNHLSSYLFFVVLDGAGWLEYNGERYELSEGDMCFIDCRRGYSQSSSKTLWALSWVHWTGNNMPAIYNKYCERGGKPVFHPEDPTVYTTLLDSLYTTAASESYIRDVEINTLLSEMVGLLFAETVWNETVWKAGCEKPVGMNTVGMNTGDKGATAIDVSATINVSAIKSYIDIHYQDQLTLELLADRFYFSKHYLARAFKESYGMSVGSYIQIVRVGRAKELLRFSLLNIDVIAEECGYSDPNFFSRQFKKVEGVSPSSFRRNWMSKSSENSGKEPEESVDNTV